MTSYAYSNGRLQSMTGPFGHALTFAYNAQGNLATVTDPAGGLIQYGYDADENLTSVSYPDGTARSYHYEHAGYPLHALTGITDENGSRYASFGYNATNGKASYTEYATTSNGSPQQRFSLVYNSATQTTVTDPAGNNEVLTFLN